MAATVSSAPPATVVRNRRSDASWGELSSGSTTMSAPQARTMSAPQARASSRR
jgi:hypothetical protein